VPVEHLAAGEVLQLRAAVVVVGADALVQPGSGVDRVVAVVQGDRFGHHGVPPNGFVKARFARASTWGRRAGLCGGVASDADQHGEAASGGQPCEQFEAAWSEPDWRTPFSMPKTLERTTGSLASPVHVDAAASWALTIRSRPAGTPVVGENRDH
jgi:hypothetical protein